MAEGAQLIAYEAPLNERIRTFLRLEHLFAQYRHYQRDRSVAGARSMLHTLIDILTLLSKSDYKAEIIKELGEQQANLAKLASRSGVDQHALRYILDEINSALNAMQQLSPQLVGTALRDNEFLLSVQNRFTLPGGTCSFDAPALHHWLSRPMADVQRSLDQWFADLSPFDQCIGLYLRLLRQSTEPTVELARTGMFVYTPDSAYLLVRVLVDPKLDVYPEISAGRHRFSVRFMQQRDINQSARQAAMDITFRLHCCLL